MATESNLQQSSSGVRTYRGRTLEEILPQIRAELGADAIILREREGLVGRPATALVFHGRDGGDMSAGAFGHRR